MIVAQLTTAPSAAYADPDYARALAFAGRPRALPACGGWLLERDIPGSAWHDAMGCYPLFQCENWPELPGDLAALAAAPRPPVAVSAVVDPLSCDDADLLSAAFPDLMRPFKDHYLVDLTGDPAAIPGAHHRRCLRKAARHFAVELCRDPLAHLDDWWRLYRELCARHDIRGVAAFGRDSFAGQLALPGTLLLRACCGADTVAMQIWYVAGPYAWYHLGAADARGYGHGGAPHALTWTALDALKERGVARADLGGSAGTGSSGRDGLARFKSGWSNATGTARICGRIVVPAAYRELAAGRAVADAEYFPAYRAGERTASG
jgi:hypothetical protein